MCQFYKRQSLTLWEPFTKIAPDNMAIEREKRQQISFKFTSVNHVKSVNSWTMLSSLTNLYFFHWSSTWTTQACTGFKPLTSAIPVQCSTKSTVFITNQLSDLLPVYLSAQLVEWCTGIAEIKGSNPLEHFRLFLATAKIASITAMIFFHFILHPALTIKIIWLSF